MRPFSPLPADHPLVRLRTECAACRKPFAAGDITCLVPLGPGDSEEERGKARLGKAYNSVAVPVHYACATGIEQGEEFPIEGTLT